MVEAGTKTTPNKWAKVEKGEGRGGDMHKMRL